MKTSREVYDWICSQSWAEDFEREIVSTHGLTLVGFIKCCKGDFSRFIYEGCNNTDEVWKERATSFSQFLSK